MAWHPSGIRHGVETSRLRTPFPQGEGVHSVRVLPIKRVTSLLSHTRWWC